MLKRVNNNFHIASINGTINELVNSGKSLSRFGDGEIEWLFKENFNSFEENSDLLRERLLEILNSSDDNIMIGLPDMFTGNDGFTKESDRYYKIFLSEYGNRFLDLIQNNNYKFYNSCVSRLYMDYKNKSKFLDKLSKIRQIWESKNVLLIEGKYSRFGVGNKLLDNANAVYRIECPSKYAFESYNKIFNYSLNYLENNKEHYLVLIALGPTATVLSYDLSNYGYRAIDIGHLDLEYEWYLHNANKKINLSNRFVNEVNNGDSVKDVSNLHYKKEIVHIF